MDFAGRSIHGVPRYARQQAEHPVQIIDGDVRSPQSLLPGDLAELPRFSFLEQFHNPDNSYLPASSWSGMTLRAIIELAEPDSEAGWIHVSAGPYATVVAMPDVDAVLLCDGLDDAPIPAERGGPWRLVKPDDRYF